VTPATQIVQLNGRKLAVEDSGPSSGVPVLVHNGAGSRHLFPAAVREAQRSGFRLIGYDRPGFGGSTAMPGRVVADCAEDVRAIFASLGISRAAVWGSSGGGPYALATAALLAEAAAAVCLFAPLGPYGAPGLDFADGMGDGFREEIRMFFEEPARARAEFRAQSAEFAPLAASPGWWMDRWGHRAGTDAAHSQEWANYLALCNRDGFGDDDEGWWEDWRASFQPWGFDLTTIQAPVILWHGLRDTSPPPAHSRWLAELIPHATAHFPGGQDHTNVEEDNRSAAFAWLTERAALRGPIVADAP
jgi:pimeloyl-ACP methyl ester carboxylesterase